MTHKTVPVGPTPGLKRHALEAAQRLSMYAAAPFFPDVEMRGKVRQTTPEWWDGLANEIEEAQPLIHRALLEMAAPPSPVTELEVMLAGSLRDLLSATESQVLSLSEMRTNARAALADVWSYSPELVREIVAAELRKAQEAEHAAPHAGVYQGLTDHIVGLIREDRKAQEGREPVAWRVRRSDGEHELFFHEPTAKQRAECFVPHSSAEPLYTSPPPKSDEPAYAPKSYRAAHTALGIRMIPDVEVPKSDEAVDAERYRWLRRKVCVIGKSTYCGEETGIPIFDFVNLPDVGEVVNRDSASTLDAAIDAALAAQQKGGAAS